MRVEVVASEADADGSTRETFTAEAPLRDIRPSNGGPGDVYFVITVGGETLHSFVIHDPVAVFLERQPRSRCMQLRIEARNQISMLVRFLDPGDTARQRAYEQAEQGYPGAGSYP